jgi:hypothetical protein
MRPDYRLFSCLLCRLLVAVCSHCDRGQVYCSAKCSSSARSRSVREAGRRYQATERGRRLHAARQARYLIRREAKMTHQASPAVAVGSTLAEPVLAAAAAARGWVVEPARVLCSVCGSPCRPFGRWNFLP